MKTFFSDLLTMIFAVAATLIYVYQFGALAHLKESYQKHLVQEYSIMICHISANSERANWTSENKACFDGVVKKAREDVDAAAR